LNDYIENPIVSVVIPCYNVASYIGDTIESILSQTYKNIEIVIVDDGSSDDSKQVIEEYRKQNNNIELIVQKNSGVAIARNNGIRHSNGKYIALLDADDLFLNDNINQKVNFLLQHKNFKAVISDYYIFNKSQKEIIKILPFINLLQNILYFEGEGIAGSSNILLEKEIFYDVGLFNSKLSTSADKHMWIKIFSKYQIGYISQPLFMYRMHDKQMHKNIPLMAHDWRIILQEIKEKKILLPKDISYNKTYAIVNLIIAINFFSDKKYFMMLGSLILNYLHLPINTCGLKYSLNIKSVIFLNLYLCTECMISKCIKTYH